MFLINVAVLQTVGSSIDSWLSVCVYVVAHTIFFNGEEQRREDNISLRGVGDVCIPTIYGFAFTRAHSA